MNDFFEKMKEDSKFNALIKLAGYSIVIIVAIIFIVASPNSPITGDNDDTDDVILKLPDKYDYTFTINKDDRVVTYKGDNTSSKITKKEADIETVYKIVDKNYYLESGDDLKKVSLDEVYDVISYEYVNIEWINKLINLSKEHDNKTLIVYVSDIVTESNTQDYITMNIGTNELSIDYTNLMKITDENINNCTLVFEYSGKE